MTTVDLCSVVKEKSIFSLSRTSEKDSLLPFVVFLQLPAGSFHKKRQFLVFDKPKIYYQMNDTKKP